MQETWVWTLGREDPLKEEMATHSSILAWRIPWTEAPGELWSMGSQRIKHDRVNEHAFRVREACLCHLRDLTLLWLVGAGGSVLSVSGLCLLDPCCVTFSSCQACGPAGEHTTWRADSLRKWHPGPHVLGKSCSLQTWAGRAHEIMSLATTWMDLEIIIHREVRHRQIPYDITYLQNLKKIIQMNLFTKLKQTHRLRKQIYGRRGGENKLITKGEMLREE